MAAAAPTPARRRARRQDRVLLGTLLRAFYWMDDGLQAEMRRRAGFSLPRAQSMIMVALSERISTQAELAKRLKVSKQAIQQALRPMVEQGLVRIDPDPDNGRQRLVRMTPRGEAMRDVAHDALQALERELARRIGRDRVEALHDALNAEWGPSPAD
jgi:DNA-binding MarR family transcriptional regulator